jgi:A/G-specific adenine glycosylase
MSNAPATQPVSAIQKLLLDWYDKNARDLPWRQTRDPYRVLVSEVMLQQTQVDRVLPYYERWLGRFPDVRALADAPTAEAIRAWAGLGYNRRAVNLQRTARHVVSELGGTFPSTVEELQRLPGIGPYTAGAIACFAFEQDVAFLDTNIRRVIHRLRFGPELPQPLATEKQLRDVAEELVPAGQGWRWGQAIMEFGALHCTARKPLCVVCPLQAECRAFPTIQSLIATRAERTDDNPPFEQTSRYFRGRLLAELRDAHPDRGIPLASLGPRIRPDFTEDHLPWLRGLVHGLARDGLALVAEAAPPYDDGAGEVVRLP